MRVLIVDDSAFARSRIARLLSAAGHEPLEASSGQQTLQMVAESPPDAMTVDLLMPDMDGLELIRRLHAAYPALPLIAVSADIQEATQREALLAGARAFVSKSGRLAPLLGVLADLPGRPATELMMTLLQQDAFTEMMNAAMGRAANALASLLERRVILTVPKIEIMPVAALYGFLERRISAASASIRQRFQGRLIGDAALIFPAGHAEILLHAVLNQSELPGFSEAERAVLAEIGNVVLNAAIARLGDQQGARLAIGMPTVNTHQSIALLVSMLQPAAAMENHAIVLLSRLMVGEVHLVVYLILLLPEADIRQLLATVGA